MEGRMRVSAEHPHSVELLLIDQALTNDGALARQIAEVAGDDCEVDALLHATASQLIMTCAARLIGRSECLVNKKNPHHEISNASITIPLRMTELICGCSSLAANCSETRHLSLSILSLLSTSTTSRCSGPKSDQNDTDLAS